MTPRTKSASQPRFAHFVVLHDLNHSEEVEISNYARPRSAAPPRCPYANTWLNGGMTQPWCARRYHVTPKVCMWRDPSVGPLLAYPANADTYYM